MGYVQCRSCHGIGKTFFNRRDKNGRYYEKVVDCKACSGTGINQKFYSKNCEKCYAEIIYPRDSNHPPRYCRNCKAQIQAEKQAERERQAAKWKEKYCKGCGATIKYNVDWNRIPELCPDCVAKEKAKWKNKSCEACGRDVKYNTDWPKPPRFCRDCANVLRILKGKEGVNKAKALEYFHRQPQIVQDGSRKTGNYVTVKSGYSRDYRKICSDFIIRDKGLRGVHYHIVIDIDGNIIMNECREDHD